MARYIDDIFCVWTGSRPSLDAFLDRLNTRHSTLRFTWVISHAYVEFFDLNIFKGKRFHQLLDLSTHLKKKKTFQYLHFSSCHSRSVFKGLVKGEAIRFLRSNTHAPTIRRIKNKFRTHLMLRGYPTKFVDPILKKNTHNLRSNYLPTYSPSPSPSPSPSLPPNSNPSPSPRLPLNPSPSPSLPPNPSLNLHLITTYSPHYIDLREFLNKNWHIIVSDPILTRIFPLPPQLCYRKNTPVKKMLVRTALLGPHPPSSTELPLIITPMHPCTPSCLHSQCQLCSQIIHRRILYSAHTHHPFPLTVSNITCTHSNIIYCLICIKCNKMYVGQTSLNLCLRFRKYRASAKDDKKKTWPLYRYFRQGHHSFENDHRVIPLESCRKENLLEREQHWIDSLQTVIPHGLNSKFR